MTPNVLQIIEVMAIGLVAGTLGGLAGIGGSMIILPGLHFFIGEPRASTHHLYMAAAMAVNFAVSLPAAIRHHRNGLVRVDLLPTLLISTAVLMLVGVFCSNLFDGTSLRVGLAIFLLAYCAFNIFRILKPRPKVDLPEYTSVPRLAISGGATGFVGGMLGLGGGVLQVPALQVLCGLRLKQSIATSSAVICVTAIIGASAKLLTLHTHGEKWLDAIVLAGILAPTAVIGGMLGAWLTHKLPVRWVRVVMVFLLIFAAARLSGIMR